MNRRHFFTFFIINLLLMMSVGKNSQATAQTPDLTWMEQIPVIELTYDPSQFDTETFCPATFTYHSVDSTRQYSCAVRHRGGSSVVFAKPNYAVKFYDEAGASLDVSFLGMRSDNHWILDAASGDYSKMRNRVSMDLWLDFSRKPYHQSQEKKAINGTRGRFVEVYVNGSYSGLFCLSERVDRKQLKLKKFKTDAETGETYYRGLLYKALYSNGTRTPFFFYNQQPPSSDLIHEWDGMKNEYPDVLEGEPWSWEPLITSVNKLAFASSSFRTNVETYYDLPVFIDYMLYLDLMCAADNVGKNYYCWFYDYTSGDTRMGYTPWDMDATWGVDWAGEPVATDRVMSNRSNFHTRMKASYKGYADTLSLRYAELRHSFWAEDSLYAYFDRYFQLFDETGALDREYARWYGTNCRVRHVSDEQQRIHQWIHDRLIYMDQEYHYDPAAIRRPHSDADRPARHYNLFGQPISPHSPGFHIIQR